MTEAQRDEHRAFVRRVLHSLRLIRSTLDVIEREVRELEAETLGAGIRAGVNRPKLPKSWAWCTKGRGSLHIREKEGLGVSLCGGIRSSNLVADPEAVDLPTCRRCVAKLEKLGKTLRLE